MADDYVRRTAITRLEVTDEQRDLFEETIAEWKRGCQLATESRVRCSLALPGADDGYQRQYLDSDEWSVTESTLTARDGDYFFTHRLPPTEDGYGAEHRRGRNGPRG